MTSSEPCGCWTSRCRANVAGHLRVMSRTALLLLIFLTGLASCGPQPPGDAIAPIDSHVSEPFQITIFSPTDRSEFRLRGEIPVKGQVTVKEGGMGPESITVKIEKGKGHEFGSFGLVPKERGKSYEFEARIKAPPYGGTYELSGVGIYRTTDEAERTEVRRIRSKPVTLRIKD